MKGESVIVLAYHAVGTCDQSKDPYNLFVSPERFAAQMRWLARRARIVPLADAIGEPSDAKGLTVAITFDDAYTNLLDHALPVLAQHGFQATVFLPTAHIGKSNTWDPPTGCDLSIMDEADLKRWRDAGMDVQSHGHNHIHMGTSDAGTVKNDISRSIETLGAAGLLGDPLLLAYPFSDGNETSDEIAQSLGILRAFSIERPAREPFVAPRVAITGRDSMLAFVLKTSGYYTTLRHSPAVYAAYRIASRVLRRKAQ